MVSPKPLFCQCHVAGLRRCVRRVEPGRAAVHDAGRGDSLRLRARGLGRGHPAADRQGRVRHGLRQLGHRVQPRQGRGQQDAGRDPQPPHHHPADPRSPLDDLQEPAHHQPPETGLPAPQGTLAVSLSSIMSAMVVKCFMFSRLL